MVVPADNHVHSEWSYDTTDQASMTGACERALDVGVPAIAFTEHLDFTLWGPGDPGQARGLEPRHRSRITPLDVTGYLAAIEECRQRFPDLRTITLHPSITWTLSIASAPAHYSSRAAATLAETLISHVDR